MKLSVIIPVLNEEANLCDLIPQLTLELNAADEIIVVDASCEKINDNYGSSLLQRFEVTTQQRAFQMNFGAKQAQGDVFYFVHADLVHREVFVKTLNKHSKRGSNMDVIHLDSIRINGT